MIGRNLTPEQRPLFRRRLLAWYRANRRDLPWRRTEDPYRIWVSEIMLQQTRVAAVLDHYQKFLQRFPRVGDLAAARESSVLAAWSGLGYYRRARNLHSAAKRIVTERQGKFPRSSEDWRELPGIGRYTAAAIASIAFNEPAAVLDGNVERVLQRLLAGRQNSSQLWNVAQELLDPVHPCEFNQAMMELGATVCVPAQPKCALCPIHEFCRTRGRSRVSGPKPRQLKRQLTCVLTRRGDSVLLAQRPMTTSLMPGMWELPQATDRFTSDKILFSVRHSITVTDYEVHVAGGRTRFAGGKWISISRLPALPLTGLARKILRRAGVI